ncbi:MAG: hypothetical protein LBK59_05765, partial [Bifidobacteriaceae bacterium]|nr:hypothetical protein [Bifidobacteriaceae bacterium]
TQAVGLDALGTAEIAGVVFSADPDSGAAIAAVDLAADGAAIAVRVPSDSSAIARAFPVVPLTP